MKAYVLHKINDFQYEEAENPIPAKDTVIVKVKAAGICGSDIPRIYKTGTYSYPLIPGHEFSGVVTELGEGVEQNWLNKRVGVFPLIPCMECTSCQKAHYEMCKNYNYLGSRTSGGFAEYVQVPVWNLLELPEEVSFEQAAMLEPMAVAVHAIRRSIVKTTDAIAVCGLGTIGMFVVMFLQEMGCENIYLMGNKDFQKERIEQMGISPNNFCDIRTNHVEEWIKDKTDGNGVDIFFDCVGKNEILTQGIHCVAAGGTILLVGNPTSDVNLEKNVYWKILRSQLSLIGTWNASFTHEKNDDWHYVLEKLKQKKICPKKMITHKFEFQDLRSGFEIMRDKKEDYIKVMGIMEME